MLLSFYFKIWPSVKEKEKKTEWLLISFNAFGRRPSLREKRSSAITIGEKCQGEKKKYNFFSPSLFSLRFFFWPVWTKINYSRQERTYLTSHRVSFFLILFHVFRSDRWLRTRDLCLKYNQSIIYSYRTFTFIKGKNKKRNEHVFHTISDINKNRKYMCFTLLDIKNNI